MLSLYIDILTLRPKVFFLFYSYFFVAISEPLTHRDPQSTIVKSPIIALVKMTKSGHLFPESRPIESLLSKIARCYRMGATLGNAATLADLQNLASR